MTTAGSLSATGRHRHRLVLVFVITAVVLVAELIGAWLTGSLALLADAGHMLTDVAGVSLALLAAYLAARPANDARTFGLYRLEVLAAATNAVVLFALAAYIVFEAWRRFSAPPQVESGLMLIVAVVGLVANGISLRILHPAQEESLNMRGAYLEVLGDLLASIAVLVAAGIILLTGWELADPIASVVIGLLIVPRAWALFREAVDVLLEATPRGISLSDVRRHILETEGVQDVHDLHAWTITSGMPVVSAHVVLRPEASPPDVLDRLCGCLGEDFDVEHCTFQLETSDRRRVEDAHHA
jgi:cobalt-zinc-cadmium efflux system protein